jgi:hypothetical protein
VFRLKNTLSLGNHAWISDRFASAVAGVTAAAATSTTSQVATWLGKIFAARRRHTVATGVPCLADHVSTNPDRMKKKLTPVAP